MATSANGTVPEGQYTATVYTAIKETRYAEAVHLLTSELGVSNLSFGMTGQLPLGSQRSWESVHFTRGSPSMLSYLLSYLVERLNTFFVPYLGYGIMSAEFPSQSGSTVAIELLLLSNARLQSSFDHVRTAGEGLSGR